MMLAFNDSEPVIYLDITKLSQILQKLSLNSANFRHKYYFLWWIKIQFLNVLNKLLSQTK